ncbi:MAG: alpha/beta hydrolase fold domain-containing protein [Anaerolineae bacterium]|nr:alpha/beta hydrolase fold domain-containing protein [Anaerolineae bacterium]
MPRTITHQQAIKKGKRFCKAATVGMKVQSIFKHAKAHPLRDEVFVDTEFGKVRTLWYGFEDPGIALVLFDLYNGGFTLSTADMDEAPDFPYPAAVNQIYAVVEHVYQNAENYTLDREKMAIGGHSAGENLSTVTCMKAKKARVFQVVVSLLHPNDWSARFISSGWEEDTSTSNLGEKQRPSLRVILT